MAGGRYYRVPGSDDAKQADGWKRLAWTWRVQDEGFASWASWLAASPGVLFSRGVCAASPGMVAMVICG